MKSIERALIFLILTLITISAQGQENELPPSAEKPISRYALGEELIFTLIIDRYVIGEAFAVLTSDGYFYDVDTYLNALEFPIQKRGNQYQGWFIDEDYSFTLTVAPSALTQSRIESSLHTKDLNQSEIRTINGADYVSMSFIRSVFAIEHEVDEENLRITLNSKYLLPAQARAARSGKTVNSRERRNIAEYPRLNRGYEILSPQALDFQLSANYREDADELNGLYSVLGGREMGLLNTRFFITGTDSDLLGRARLRLSRNFNNDLDNVWWKPTRIEAGDVIPAAIGAGLSRQESIGLNITNRPTTQSYVGDRLISISGEVQTNWDAELYRNGILIGQLFNINGGRYEFNDVELYTGNNEFEVVLYGPQGQEIRRTESSFVDPNNVGEAGLIYSSSFTKLDSDLFGTDTSAIEQDIYDWTTSINTSLADGIGLRAGVSTQFGDESNFAYFAGINSQLGSRTISTLGVSQQDNDFRRLDLNIKSSSGNHNYILGFNFNQNLITQVDSRSISGRINGNFSPAEQIGLSYENELSIARSDFATTTRATNSIGVTTLWLRVFNSIDYQKLDYDDSKVLTQRTTFNEDLSGSINLQANIGPINTRIGVSYDLQDGFDVRSYLLNLSWRPNENLKTRLTYEYSPISTDARARLNVGWQFNDVIFSADISHADTYGFSAGLFARVSIGSDPFTSDIFVSEKQISQQGTIAVRVFVDTNNDAIYQPNEKVLSGVEVKTIQAVGMATTDENGIAILSGLSSRKATDIEINRETLDDPYLKPIIEGVSILPKQGFVDKLDYAVVPVSEIEGIVSFTNQLQTPNVNIMLKNTKGEVIREVRSEFDGFYLISDVKPGNYYLVIEQDEIDKHDAHPVAPLKLSIGNTSIIYENIDIEITNKTYTIGYTAKLGEFSNMGLMKSYWASIRVRYPQLFGISNAFFETFTLDQTERHTLNFGFSTKSDQIENICALMHTNSMACSLTQYDRLNPR